MLPEIRVVRGTRSGGGRELESELRERAGKQELAQVSGEGPEQTSETGQGRILGTGWRAGRSFLLSTGGGGNSKSDEEGT